MKRLFIALGLLAASAASASVTVTVNGTNYTIPQTNEKGWGTNVTNWIQAISANTIQPSGGLFTLTADLDLGSSFGLKSLYYKTRTSNVASLGNFRLANADNICWRNSTNSADLCLVADATDGILDYNGVALAGTAATQTLTNKTIAAGSNTITGLADSNISSSAAIARSKLATGSLGAVVINDGSTGVLSSEAQLAPGRGGSGINNSGTFAWGSNNITFTTSGTTGVTLPTAGTLSTLAGSETLTNKTIAAGSNTISGLTNTNLSGSAAITNANLANMASSATNVGTVKGNLSGSSATPSDVTATTASTASTVAVRDSNANLKANSHVDGYTTAATANTTTTLSAASTKYQYFTGTTAGQVLKMPDATTLVTGWPFIVENRSNQTIAIQDNSGGAIVTLGANQNAYLTCTGVGTAAGTWDNVVQGITAGGTVTSFTDSSGLFSVANSTTTPTTTYANQNANTSLRGPRSGSAGTPSYRADVGADLPSMAGSNSGAGVYNLGLSTSVAANALTISLKQSDGSSDPSSTGPVTATFKSAGTTSASTSIVSQTSALSVTVRSGDTLGTTNGLADYLWVYLLNDASTLDLCVSSHVMFEDNAANSSTQITGAAKTSSSTLYCASSHTGGKPTRLIGVLIYTEATAGTWASAMTSTELLPPYCSSGTYQPTMSNVANTTVNTAYVGQWLRCGNSFTFSGKADLSNTTASSTSSTIKISTPIPTNISSQEHCTGTSHTFGTTQNEGGTIIENSANNVEMDYQATLTTNRGFEFIYTCRVL